METLEYIFGFDVRVSFNYLFRSHTICNQIQYKRYLDAHTSYTRPATHDVRVYSDFMSRFNTDQLIFILVLAAVIIDVATYRFLHPF